MTAFAPIHPAPTLLIVDDEPAVCKVLRLYLESKGFRILTAAGGAEATAVFRREAATIDAVLLDMAMPEVDGAQCFQIFAAVEPRVPVVFCSGYPPSNDPSLFTQEPRPFGFLAKPFDFSRLTRMVEAAVAKRRSHAPPPIAGGGNGTADHPV
ncbi:MAG: response regulator [Planctomycetia bacterium]